MAKGARTGVRIAGHAGPSAHLISMAQGKISSAFQCLDCNTATLEASNCAEFRHTSETAVSGIPSVSEWFSSPGFRPHPSLEQSDALLPSVARLCRYLVLSTRVLASRST